MSIVYEGFTGPSYQLTNRWAGIERLVNWYTIPNETSEEKKYKMVLEPFPGNALFSALPVPAPFNQPCRGLIEVRGHVYGVNGNRVFAIKNTAVFVDIGKVENDGNPVSMVANGNGQTFIASGGKGYVIPNNAAANSLQGIADPAEFLGASYSTFQDGYIINIVPNSNKFQISGDDDTPLGDARIWDAANVSVQAGQADNLRAVISSREYVRLLGARRSQVYQNVGNAGIGGFPFQSYNETFIETGIAAPFSLVDLGESLIWIGEDARGQRACWRDPAFRPERVSTFAIEQFWQGYSRVDDAVAFAFIWKGHLMYQITFPSATVNTVTGAKIGATWVYDATASDLIQKPVWAERNYTDAYGYQMARSEQFHCYAFGKHLVGSTGIDGNPGAIYQYSDTQYYDCGTNTTGGQARQAIFRDRICPHLWGNYKRLIINRIEFELARGVGADGGNPLIWDEATMTWQDATFTWDNAFGENPDANPMLLLRWSNDGGNTWTPEQNIPVGRVGEYLKRVYWNRTGYARDRVFWVRCSNAVYWSILGAELDVIACGS